MRTFENELNPLYQRVDELADFSDIKPKSPTEKEEYTHLELVTGISVNTFKKQLQRLKNLEIELEDQVKIIAMETDLDSRRDAVSVYNKILKMISDCVDRINLEIETLDSPYFGKIVFDSGRSDIDVYIGRFALVDPQTYKPLISDWRAPIANIYYENSGPKKNVDFDTPAGKRNGDLKQKRQFDISEARIRNIYDAKSGNVAADEFLLSQLHKRLGQKLKDIVATIQSQQNEIIREEINKPVIIQGVAGSGKTTILLHRLAYLFYTYKENIHPENTLLILPNKMFLDYISDVLPNLGVTKVESNTYMFWAKNILGWDNTYTIYNGEEDLKIKEFKGSLEFLDILEKYIEDFEDDLLRNIPYSNTYALKERYYQLKRDFPYISMNERLKLSLEYAFAQEEFNKQRIREISEYDYQYKEEKMKEIQKYFSNKTQAIEIYRDMFRKKMFDRDICKYTLEGVKRSGKLKTFRMEDLAPIVYIHFAIHGYKEYEKEYVMIDEGQDLSYIQISTLLKIAKNGNITIAGDLAQSIIPPFYIRDWNNVIKLISDRNNKGVSYHQLNRCYRTTIEIIEFANKVFKDRFPSSYKLPEAVLRHGEDIRVIENSPMITEMKEEEIKILINDIKNQFEKGSVTCALVCRDKQHAKEVYNKIKSYENILERDILDYSSEDYKRGLLVLPVEDAKGLEFDTVIIVDINKDTYPDTELSTRLFYVAVTRALHRLIILSNKNKSPILR